jgi:hypothetical protein
LPAVMRHSEGAIWHSMAHLPALVEVEV